MNESYLKFVKDQFSIIGPITIKKMFGGAGIYLYDTMFGLIADDVIYLKVDDTNKPDYVEEGMEPFTYNGKKAPIKMSYYQLPEDVLEDQDELAEWANKAVAISVNSKKNKK